MRADLSHEREAASAFVSSPGAVPSLARCRCPTQGVAAAVADRLAGAPAQKSRKINAVTALWSTEERGARLSGIGRLLAFGESSPGVQLNATFLTLIRSALADGNRVR